MDIKFLSTSIKTLEKNIIILSKKKEELEWKLKERIIEIPFVLPEYVSYLHDIDYGDFEINSEEYGRKQASQVKEGEDTIPLETREVGTILGFQEFNPEIPEFFKQFYC